MIRKAVVLDSPYLSTYRLASKDKGDIQRSSLLESFNGSSERLPVGGAFAIMFLRLC